jgi:hypothetical protein
MDEVAHPRPDIATADEPADRDPPASVRAPRRLRADRIRRMDGGDPEQPL